MPDLQHKKQYCDTAWLAAALVPQGRYNDSKHLEPNRIQLQTRDPRILQVLGE